jgi:hypothetical protein
MNPEKPCRLRGRLVVQVVRYDDLAEARLQLAQRTPEQP